MRKILLLAFTLLITETALAGQCQDFFWRGYIVNYLAGNLLDGKSAEEVTQDVIRLSQGDIDTKAAKGAIEVLEKRNNDVWYLHWKQDYKASLNSMCEKGKGDYGVTDSPETGIDSY